MSDEIQGLRRLGYDSVSGKTAYAFTAPGGLLEGMADMSVLETATVWHALAEAMTNGTQLDADEAHFVLARVVEALGEVIPIAARVVEDNDALALYAEAGRDIGAGMRGMKR
ncbi:hypothetical protein [Streptomyces geysiriensis]|uniref:hypothetical protein n=1 Tax=Streptomyces geysiriensis TaxID=68207 RepID=UPI001C7D49E1|nr:hypothetical protein [Streptomyces geysiriensis]MBX4176398.1 hypothetical protein [Streptomyces geysiriensis]